MLTIQNDKGVVIAYLNNLEDAKVKEVINGEYLLDFVALIEPLKTEFLYDNNNLICYNNDLFRVVQLEELHTEDNMLTVAVTAEHLSYDCIKNKMQGFYYTNATASYVMIKCLAGTGFNFVGTDITNFKTDIQYTEECNAKQISIAIANNWRGELKYFRKDIELLKQRGKNRGVDFRFGKNLSSIKRICNFSEATISYEVDVMQGAELEELGYFELGDTIRVIDDALNIDFDVRIIELERDILTGLNSKVVLGDSIKDIRSSFKGIDEAKKKAQEAIEKSEGVEDTLNNSAADWDKIKDITDEQGNVIAEKLQGMLNTANAMIQNGTGTMKWTGNSLVCHDQPREESSTFICELSAQGLRYANAKNSDGTWRWRTALNAEGLVADKVTATAINGLTIDSVILTSTEITSGTIRGVLIEGATFYAGDRKSGNYILIAPSTPFRVYRDDKVMMEIYSSSDGGYISIFNINNVELYRVECDSTNRGCVRVTSPFIATETGLFSLRTNGRQEYGRSNNGAILLDASRRGSSVANGGILLKTNDRISREVPDGDIEMYSSGNVFVKVGYSGWQSSNRMTIDGHVYCYGDMTVEGTLTAHTRLSSKNISELEVRNMELEEQLIQEGLARSELEVTLMERGIL